VLHEVLRLERPELALLGVMMLRGPQTLNELRTRTERMVEFADMAELERTLDGLAAREEPLVLRILRQPGQREERYAHLLGGDVDVSEIPAPTPTPRASRGDELGDLREEVDALRRDLDELRKELGLG
jgi:uncharacterized protein YceH (UPF0502 family)